ncbi:MAG: hypothetical protein IJM45_01515 [Clostridia bacterium]|nr:hypothetical protein [Clostridia bacterium]
MITSESNTDPLKIKAVIDTLDPPDKKIKRRKLAVKSPIRKKSPYPDLPAGRQKLRGITVKSHFQQFLGSGELSPGEAASQIAEILTYAKSNRYNDPKLSGKTSFVFDGGEYGVLNAQLYHGTSTSSTAARLSANSNSSKRPSSRRGTRCSRQQDHLLENAAEAIPQFFNGC